MPHEREQPLSPQQARRTSDETAPARALKIVDNRIDSTDLFVGTREVTIQHGEMSYRLRLTAQDKLILTK